MAAARSGAFQESSRAGGPRRRTLRPRPPPRPRGPSYAPHVPSLSPPPPSGPGGELRLGWGGSLRPATPRPARPAWRRPCALRSAATAAGASRPRAAFAAPLQPKPGATAKATIHCRGHASERGDLGDPAAGQKPGCRAGSQSNPAVERCQRAGGGRAPPGRAVPWFKRGPQGEQKAAGKAGGSLGPPGASGDQV